MQRRVRFQATTWGRKRREGAVREPITPRHRLAGARAAGAVDRVASQVELPQSLELAAELGRILRQHLTGHARYDVAQQASSRNGHHAKPQLRGGDARWLVRASQILRGVSALAIAISAIEESGSFGNLLTL